MALYQNGILISGANTLPQMTLAEYQALPVSERPTYWERTDLNYSNIPASDVTYGSGSVKDALDAHTTAISTNTTDIGTINTKLGKFQHGTYTTEGITKNTEINVTVPFPSAFSSIPTVVVTPVCSFGYGGYLSGHLKSVTKTQFIYNIKNSSNADLTLLLGWMATNM